MIEEIKQSLEKIYSEFEKLENEKNTLTSELNIVKDKVFNERKQKTLNPTEDKDYYYYIGSCGDVCKAVLLNCPTVHWRMRQGNYFKSSEEAQQYLEKLKTKAELKAVADELNGDTEIDWNDLVQDKYCIYYNFSTKRLCTCNNFAQEIGQIYCLDEYFVDKAIERIGERQLIEMIRSGV
jgi:hypothetical protein